VTELGETLSAVAAGLSELLALSTWAPPAPLTTDLTT